MYARSLLPLVLMFIGTACSNGGDGGDTDEGNPPDNNPPPKPANVVFITSETGTGLLSSWASAGGMSGTVAGDSVCQTAAEAAGSTGVFRAWISDSTDDAYCRIHNLTGKKANNCGLPDLPSHAGPWQRKDGAAFSDVADPISGIKPLLPVVYDEWGIELTSDVSYWTGTDTSGTEIVDFTCGDWTGGNGVASGGFAYGVTDHWSYGFWIPVNCDTSDARHLLCMQIDATGPLPDYQATGKLIFVTSSTQDGNLSGLTGADAICQDHADTAGLSTITNPKVFKAWLSDSNSNMVDRIQSEGPWVRVDGVKVADNKLDLTDDIIDTAISVDENGTEIDVANVFTGTNGLGIGVGTFCQDWTISVSVQDPTTGQSGWANARWTENGTRSCSSTLRLYCIED